MPVLEGMATGLPVVTTDCLGIRTFCRHGENCLVAPTDDAASEWGAGTVVVCSLTA
jgi:glycosyltransferase involved in cell wall biosynthesis